MNIFSLEITIEEMFVLTQASFYLLHIQNAAQSEVNENVGFSKYLVNLSIE